MAGVVSNGAQNINAAGLNIIAANPSSQGSVLPLTTNRVIAATFSHNQNIVGVALNIRATASGAPSAFKTVKVSLEEIKTGTSTLTAVGDTVTYVAHGLAVNDEVSYTTTVGSVILNTTYFVITVPTADTFTMSSTLGGATFDITSNGTPVLNIMRRSQTAAPTAISLSTADAVCTGGYFHDFIFGSVLAIDTTAGKWRFLVQNTTGTTNWGVGASDATNLFYIAWSDTAATLVSGADWLYAKDEVTINASMSLLGVLPTGDATRSIALVVGKSGSVPQVGNNVANIKWQFPAAASYTFTLNGMALLGGYSAFRAGHAVNFTGAIAAAATSATLTAIWPHTTGTYQIHFTTISTVDTPAAMEYKNVTLTNGATTCTWTGGLVSGATSIAQVAIATANKGTVTVVSASSGTTGNSGFYDPASNNSGSSGQKMSFIMVGEAPAVQDTFITADAAVGAGSVTTSVSTGWASGDTFYIGGFNTAGTGNTTLHTVSSTAGTTVNFTGNIAGQTRKATDGYIFVTNKYGMVFTGLSTATSMFRNPSNFMIVGTQISNQAFSTVGTLGKGDDAANRSRYQVSNCSFTTTTATVLLQSVAPLDDGLIVDHINSILTELIGVANATTWLATTADIIFSNNINLWKNFNAGSTGATWATTATQRYAYVGNKIQGAATVAAIFQGVNPNIKNNEVFGCTGTFTNAPFSIVNLFNTALSGNTYNKNNQALNFSSSSTGCTFTDEVFGNRQANTLDVDNSASAFFLATFFSPTGNMKFGTTNQKGAVVGSHFRITDNNDTTDNDRGVLKYGFYQRTKSTLSDTLVRTTGGSAMRLQPNDGTNALNFPNQISERPVPTGNISGLDMSVSLWVYINNTAYDAGVFTLPALNVKYDNATTVSATATTTFGSWQKLLVSFTPATSYGQIDVWVSGATDATTTNAYIYIDDFNISYPPGVVVNLGGMDLWANATPIWPPTASIANQQSIWDELTSDHITVGTFGQSNQTIASGTAQAGTATTITLAASSSSVADFFKFGIIHITSGTGVGQSRFISAYNGTTKAASIYSSWATNPDNTSVYRINPFGSIQHAVWEALETSHLTAGSMGALVKRVDVNTSDIPTLL